MGENLDISCRWVPLEIIQAGFRTEPDSSLCLRLFFTNFPTFGLKTMTFGTMNAQQAHKEHVLAVSRDFISQPRLSEYLCPVKLGRVWAKMHLKVFKIY